MQRVSRLIKGQIAGIVVRVKLLRHTRLARRCGRRHRCCLLLGRERCALWHRRHLLLRRHLWLCYRAIGLLVARLRCARIALRRSGLLVLRVWRILLLRRSLLRLVANELKGSGSDFRHRMVLAVLVLPLVGFYRTLDKDGSSFSEVLYHPRVTPEFNVVELCVFDNRTVCFFEPLVGCKAERGDLGLTHHSNLRVGG